MRSTSAFIASVALIFAVLWPLAAGAEAEYAAFIKEDLENEKWPNLISLFENEENGATRLSYLLVPKHLVDDSVASTKENDILGVFEDLNEEGQVLPGGGLVRVLDEVYVDVGKEINEAYLEVEDVYGRDIVAWDDARLRELMRVCWLNKESPFDSAKLRALRLFRERFSIEEYGWFFSPVGVGRKVVISGLRRPSVLRVHIVIPSQGGSILTFEVGGTDRTVLRDTIRVMEDEAVPVNVSLSIEAVGISSKEVDLATLAAHLEPRLIGRDNTVISGFYQMRVSENRVHFGGFFLRDAVAPKELQIALRPGSPYCLIGAVGAVNGWQRGPVKFTFPSSEPDWDSRPPQFTLQLALLPSATRLITTDLWHHSVSFGEIWFARSTKEIRHRHLEISARMPISVKPELLFADPQGYIGRLGSRIGRRVLGMGARAQRIFAADIRETNAALEALWSYIGIARSQNQEPLEDMLTRNQEPLEVMLIKYVPTPVKGFHKSLPGDRLICYVRCFLEHKIAVEGNLPVRITEVEVPVREAHATRSVGVVLVSQEGSVE